MVVRDCFSKINCETLSKGGRGFKAVCGINEGKEVSHACFLNLQVSVSICWNYVQEPCFASRMSSRCTRFTIVSTVIVLLITMYYLFFKQLLVMNSASKLGFYLNSDRIHGIFGLLATLVIAMGSTLHFDGGWSGYLWMVKLSTGVIVSQCKNH